MGTFLYSPAIQARIATDRTIYDVSEDISRATINRRLGVSSFSMTLTNRGRKYDGAFSPMDRVTIYLRRVGPFLLVLSGYLDSVPIYSTHTASVQLRGSCSLKRLQHWAWDPGSEAGSNLMTNLLSGRGGIDLSATDGGIGQRVVRAMNEVMGWPREKIHIGAVPGDWFTSLSDLGADAIAESEEAQAMSFIGNGSLAGQNLLQGRAIIPDTPAGTGVLSRERVTVGTFGGSRGASGTMSLTGEPMKTSDASRAQWGGPYYMAAKWPYLTENGDAAPSVDQRVATSWWKNRTMLLTNPATGKGVHVRAAHWGPNSARSNTDIQVSEGAYNALGLKPGQRALLAFPADDNATPGPIVISNSPSVHPSGAGMVPDPPAPTPRTVFGTPDRKAMSNYSHPVQTICQTFAALEELLRWGVQTLGLTVHEHPSYGGVLPGAHLPTSRGGMHYWPDPAGGGAADVFWPGGGETGRRKLDQFAFEAAKRGFGLIWRSPNHWSHVHVDISRTRMVGHVVHVSDTAFRALPLPTPLNGSPGDPSSGSGPGAPGGELTAAGIGEALFSAFEFVQDFAMTQEGRMLGGKRALMNDVSFYSTIDELFKVGLRDWCSAPNGDLIGWFPDYFARFGTAARMVVEPIEVMADGFNVEWSDDNLKTHMFVTSASTNTGRLLQGAGGGLSARHYSQMSKTAGVASVEFPEMMRALFNETGPLYADGGKAFLSKFGARPSWQPMEVISSPQAEFFFAVHNFMKNWSEQFRASINLTFMPELYPGMIAAFPHWGVQAYVQGVTHNIDMQSGFTTQPTLTSWSAIEGSDNLAVPGLPIGGPLS